MAEVTNETINRSPRLIKRGDVVRVPGGPQGEGDLIDEVVRDVQVLLTLANGLIVSVQSTDSVQVVLDPDVGVELQEQISAMEAEQSE